MFKAKIVFFFVLLISFSFNKTFPVRRAFNKHSKPHSLCAEPEVVSKSHLYSVDFKFVINGLPTLSIINQNDNPQYKVAQLNCPGEITIIHTEALFIKNRRFQPANNCKEPGKLNFDVV